MRTLRSIAYAASLATSLTPAYAAEWRTSIYETDGFSVDFSGSVKAEPMQLSEEKKMLAARSTMYTQNGGNAYVYIVGATLVGPDATFDFGAGVSGTMGSYKCTKTESDATSPTAEGQMREIYASSCFDSAARVGARFFMRGRWFYQVVYVVTSDAQVADAKHFLTSFTLITPKN